MQTKTKIRGEKFLASPQFNACANAEIVREILRDGGEDTGVKLAKILKSWTKEQKSEVRQCLSQEEIDLVRRAVRSKPPNLITLGERDRRQIEVKNLLNKLVQIKDRPGVWLVVKLDWKDRPIGINTTDKRKGIFEMTEIL